MFLMLLRPVHHLISPDVAGTDVYLLYLLIFMLLCPQVDEHVKLVVFFNGCK